MFRPVALIACFAALPAFADAPVVENVTLSPNGDRWRIDVTLSHPDTGWDHYADGWAVLDMDGTEIGFRELVHPHETEQPFTRGTTITIPDGVSRIQIRPRDNVDGWSDVTYPVDVPR